MRQPEHCLDEIVRGGALRRGSSLVQDLTSALFRPCTSCDVLQHSAHPISSSVGVRSCGARSRMLFYTGRSACMGAARCAGSRDLQVPFPSLGAPGRLLAGGRGGWRRARSFVCFDKALPPASIMGVARHRSSRAAEPSGGAAAGPAGPNPPAPQRGDKCPVPSPAVVHRSLGSSGSPEQIAVATCNPLRNESGFNQRFQAPPCPRQGGRSGRRPK